MRPVRFRRLVQSLVSIAVRNVLVIILVIFAFGLSRLSPYFLTRQNLVTVARQISYIGIIGVGMTIVILTGGIDISVGSVLALTGCVFAGLMIRSGWPSAAAAVCALLLGALLGLTMGATISFLKVPPFVTTLGMMGIARGLVMVYTNRQPFSGLPQVWEFFGTGTVLSIPTSVIIWLGMVLIAWFCLSRTTFGRHIYAIGGNIEAASLYGVNVRLYTILPYVVTGTCSAVSGILLAARLNSAQPLVGQGFELQAIAAVVVGGTYIFGGRGGVMRTVVGTCLIGILANGINLTSISSWWEQVFEGVLLITTIVIASGTFRLRSGAFLLRKGGGD